MGKKNEIAEIYDHMNKLKDVIDSRFKGIEEKLRNLYETIADDRQSVKDVIEGLGRRLNPGTKSCSQCGGVGGKWEKEKYHGGIPLFMDCDNSQWWTCDKCKGTGRVPIDKKE